MKRLETSSGHKPDEADPRWQLIQRAAASRVFERSARLRGFLLYIGERALTGRVDEINEQQIGHNVFARKADYNPSEDNIVRVEARNLRRRLQEYFTQDGLGEPVVITVPKGGYVPVFEERTPAAPARRPRRTLLWLPWVLAAGFATVALILLWRGWPGEPPSVPPLWSSLFDPAHQTTIVLADSNFALFQDLTRQNVPLEDYISKKYVPPPGSGPLAILVRRQYTSLADATLASKIAQLQAGLTGHTQVRFARSMQIRDFHGGHAILIGSKRANPWVELFEGRLNFVLEYDPASGQGALRNKEPSQGEAERYVMESNDLRTGRAYGAVALTPNLTRTGNVLLIQGLNMEATEVAGEFLLSRELAARLLEAAGIPPAGPIRPFEAVLRLRAVGGAAKDAEIIAVRAHGNSRAPR